MRSRELCCRANAVDGVTAFLVEVNAVHADDPAKLLRHYSGF